MFYGQGAGELPTASACVADVMEALQSSPRREEIGWEADPGVNTRSTIVWAYVFCGIACGVTAVMLTSRLGSAHPQAAEDYLLDAIAAVWLGGTAFKDGEPNLAGTLLGALIIGTMANGLTILNVSYYYQDIATGLIILAAVIITSVQKSHKN